jgi:hypothetical protein
LKPKMSCTMESIIIPLYYFWKKAWLMIVNNIHENIKRLNHARN